MNTSDRIAFIKRQMPDVTISDEVVGDKLNEAIADVLAARYPYGVPQEETDVPRMYEYLTLNLAIRKISRMGAEGEVTHNENGINRTYGSTDDSDLLGRVLPVARLVR